MSTASSDYNRIQALGFELAETMYDRRPSDMLDWPRLQQQWWLLETRLLRTWNYDVISACAQDRDVGVLMYGLRARLHYMAVALNISDYLTLTMRTTAMSAVLTEVAAAVARDDREVLQEKGLTYGDSWKKRGGIGAFMMLARKWDRMDNLLSDCGGGPVLLSRLRSNPGDVQDDIHDLRRYVLLVEDEAATRRTL